MEHSHRESKQEHHNYKSPSHEAGSGHGGGHHTHHAHMVADFRRRFRISLILTFPVLALAPQDSEFPVSFGDSIRYFIRLDVDTDWL